MPPNAPIGAAHITIRITPKTIRPITSKTATTRSRSLSARNEIADAVMMPSTRMRRISFSTNGSTNEPGSRLSVMKPTSPPSVPPASPIDSFASARAAASGWPLKPLPGATRLPTIRPSPSATIVMPKKYASARSARPPARLRLPIDAIPMTTVTKMTGPVIAWITWMNASASHFALTAVSGATSPNRMPAAIAISTQNQSCV